MTRHLWWKVALVAGLAFLVSALFAAYLRPDMLVLFNDLMAFCTALLK